VEGAIHASRTSAAPRRAVDPTKRSACPRHDTDHKGSTALCERVGDLAAYDLSTTGPAAKIARDTRELLESSGLAPAPRRRVVQGLLDELAVYEIP
jgi:hypothetical protein